MKRSTREEWATRVARWNESGLSAPAFAAEIGVNAKTLRWWRAHLARAITSPPPKRPLARRNARAGNTSPPVTPLEFVEMTAAIASEPLEVVLPTSVRVRVRPGFDDRTLRRLLEVLESRR